MLVLLSKLVTKCVYMMGESLHFMSLALRAEIHQTAGFLHVWPHVVGSFSPVVQVSVAHVILTL